MVEGKMCYKRGNKKWSKLGLKEGKWCNDMLIIRYVIKMYILIL